MRGTTLVGAGGLCPAAYFVHGRDGAGAWPPAFGRMSGCPDVRPYAGGSLWGWVGRGLEPPKTYVFLKE